jgi:hypothetical protein
MQCIPSQMTTILVFTASRIQVPMSYWNTLCYLQNMLFTVTVVSGGMTPYSLVHHKNTTYPIPEDHCLSIHCFKDFKSQCHIEILSAICKICYSLWLWCPETWHHTVWYTIKIQRIPSQMTTVLVFTASRTSSPNVILNYSLLSSPLSFISFRISSFCCRGRFEQVTIRPWNTGHL